MCKGKLVRRLTLADHRRVPSQICCNGHSFSILTEVHRLLGNKHAGAGASSGPE